MDSLAFESPTTTPLTSGWDDFAPLVDAHTLEMENEVISRAIEKFAPNKAARLHRTDEEVWCQSEVGLTIVGDLIQYKAIGRPAALANLNDDVAAAWRYLNAIRGPRFYRSPLLTLSYPAYQTAGSMAVFPSAVVEHLSAPPRMDLTHRADLGTIVADDDAYDARIKELREAAEEEGITVQNTSEQLFRTFVRAQRHNRKLKPASLVLAHDEFRAVWRDGKDQVGLRFQSSGQIVYVHKEAAKDDPSDWNRGTVSLDKFVGHVCDTSPSLRAMLFD